jgi:hypothetical protein
LPAERFLRAPSAFCVLVDPDQAQAIGLAEGPIAKPTNSR